MKLSTSQVPTNLGQYGLPLIPESCVGGFGPVCEDGYGLLYCSIGDDMCKCLFRKLLLSPSINLFPQLLVTGSHAKAKPC